MNCMEIKDLTKKYDTFTLDNVSFNIPKGYIMGFIGENGAGKTTTIKSMLNIVKRNSGSVTILGKDIDEDEMAIKKRIGFVSGDVFYPRKRIKELTNVYKKFYDEWDEHTYQSLLKEFKLNPEKRIIELSKGMKMKYLIALALSHKAELLILDEPTSGLDPVARDGLLELFQSIVEDGEVSILFSTHITSDLDKCADFITFIQDGSIMETCSKDDLIDKYRIVTGSSSDLEKIKDTLLSYKENSLGFTGLMRSELLTDELPIRHGQPSLDEIMIYFAEKKVK